MNLPTTARRLIRRRPAHGTVIVVLPTALIRRWTSRLSIGLAVAVYLANFVVAELIVRTRIANVDFLREFPVTSWGLYAELAPDALVNPRLRFELEGASHGDRFDEYVRLYPRFMPGAFHARSAVMLGRGREYPVRTLMRFLVDRYCFERQACGAGRPEAVIVRQTLVHVDRGRVIEGVEPDRLLRLELPPR